MRRLACALLAAFAPLQAAADCPPMAEVARLAGAILDRRPAPPPPALSMADALCAREKLVVTLAQPWGDQEGWKVAPGPPPLAGALFHGTLRLRADDTLRLNEVPVLPARFGIVPEVAAGLVLRLGADGIEAAGGDHSALLRHVEAVLPFLDLTDRVHPPAIPWTPELALSLNLGTRLGVLGEAVPAAPTPDFARALGAVTATLSAEGREVARGGPALHPLDALAWLAQDLAAQGRRLRAGEHVAIAGLTPPVAAMPGAYVARLDGLGPRPRDVAVRLQ